MRVEELIGAVLEDHDLVEWRQVPARVVALFKQAAPGACRLAAWASPVADVGDRLWWHPATVTAWAEIADPEKRAAWEALPDVPGVPGLALYVEPLPPPPVAGWVLAKAADATSALAYGVPTALAAAQAPRPEPLKPVLPVPSQGHPNTGAFLSPLTQPHQAAQRLIGGPNGLTSAIVSGLLGSGLGYGSGWLMDQFLPEEHVDKGKLPLTGAAIGGGLGAVPGLWRYSAELRDKYGSAGNPRFRKLAAAGGNTGSLFLPTIPVDAFNRVVWNDVTARPNPFGTKSPWGSNEQQLGTPAYAAAATTGLLSGTAQAAGSPYVSPWQVGAAAALGAGQGWLTGLAAGKVLGALAGLKPADQAALQQAGTWGGLITGVANTLFR